MVDLKVKNEMSVIIHPVPFLIDLPPPASGR
jgi:hypothetical protein